MTQFQSTSNIMLELSTVSQNVPNYFTTQLNGSINSNKLQAFHQALRWLVEARFTGHWYPLQPDRGSGFRCINRSLSTGLDLIVYQAMTLAQWNSIDRAFAEKTWKEEFQLWCDPGCISVKDGVIPTLRVIWGSSTVQESSPLSNHVRVQSDISIGGLSSMARLNKAVPIVRPSSVDTSVSCADMRNHVRYMSSNSSQSATHSEDEDYSSSLDGSDVSLSSSSSSRQHHNAPLGRIVEPSTGRVIMFSGPAKSGPNSQVSARNSTRSRRRRGQGGAKKLAKSLNATQSLMASFGGFVSYLPPPILIQS